MTRMTAIKREAVCEHCHEPITIDFETADFSTQISRINGKTEQQRTYFIECPHCEKIATTVSEDSKEWGNRKGPSIKKAMFGFGLGCIGFMIVGALALYFAGQGIVTIMEWLTK